MKKYNLLTVFLLLVLLQLFPPIGYAADKAVSLLKQPAEAAFKTDCPNGLYLYKPRYEGNEFAPMFIVEDGRLLDPYLLAEKTGKEEFLNRYVKGKTFNVSMNEESIGKLSDLDLSFEKGIQTKEFITYIYGTGTYSGENLLPNRQYFKKNFFIETDFYQFAVPKFVASPFLKPEAQKSNICLSKGDIEKAAVAVREELFSDAKKTVSDIIKRENRFIDGDKSSINFAWAIDLGQNGRKSIIGCYSISFHLYKKQTGDNDQGHYDAGLYPLDILFILRDNGKVEKISYDDGGSPAFSFISAVDLNGDGVKEIIIHLSRNPEAEPFFGGTSIVIFSFNKNGWERVFQSAKVATAINY